VSGRVALITIAILAGLAPAASAQTPVTAGPGTNPRIAVDSRGAGHLAWINVTANTSTFRYCKLAPTARACASPFSFSNGDQDVDGGHPLVASDQRVLLVEARGVSPSISKLLWTSINGGANFSGPTQIGTLGNNGGGIAGRALLAPAGALGLGAESILTIGEVAGVEAPFQATGTEAGTASAAANLAPNVGADIALQGNRLVAVLGEFPQLRWSRYAGPVPATLDTLNDAANWSAPETIGPRSDANTELSLTSGPSGIYLGYAVTAGAGAANFVMRRFTGSGWGAPTVVARNATGPDLFQDPTGRLHALWSESSALRYRSATSTANTAFGAARTLVTGDNFAFKRLAVNAAGNGWAVWVGSQGVRGVPLTSATTYTGPTRAVQTTGFGGAYTLGVPRRCVSPGQRFRVTLTWRRQRRKGNLFVKVRRSDFYLGSRVIKRDTSVPYVHTYRVTVTQRPGSTITLRARAFIKVRRGKEPKKSIRTRVRVCG
jgi:hypothetical protein